jgi:hypothetical protein
VLHQQQCQPVSQKVHARQREGEKRVMRINTHVFHAFPDACIPYISFPTGYLLLILEHLGRGTEGTRTFCFSPSIFVSNFFSGTSSFCQETSGTKPILVKPALLSLFVLDWTQWGSLLPGCILFDSRECGELVNVFPFPLFVSPPTP